MENGNIARMRIFDTAFRLAALVLALTMFAFLVAAGAVTAKAATLRDHVTLTHDTLTVGDIFDHAGKNAAYVLGPAPAPGKEMVLSAATLLRIASALDIAWQPSGQAEQLVIRRAATIIPADTVTKNLIEALRSKVVNKKFALDMGSMNLQITLPDDLPPTMDVAAVSYNPRTARFEATIKAPSAANAVKTLTVAGTVRPLISVPVLKSALRNGDIVGPNDIQMLDFYTSEIRPDTLLKPADVIGLTPRRMVLAGKPIDAVDMKSPQLVDRGDAVTIQFKAGPLSLTTLGKALQDGARGDLIRVVNDNSHRTINAIVSGSHEVIVQE